MNSKPTNLKENAGKSTQSYHQSSPVSRKVRSFALNIAEAEKYARKTLGWVAVNAGGHSIRVLDGKERFRDGGNLYPLYGLVIHKSV